MLQLGLLSSISPLFTASTFNVSISSSAPVFLLLFPNLIVSYGARKPAHLCFICQVKHTEWETQEPFCMSAHCTEEQTRAQGVRAALVHSHCAGSRGQGIIQVSGFSLRVVLLHWSFIMFLSIWVNPFLALTFLKRDSWLEIVVWKHLFLFFLTKIHLKYYKKYKNVKP